LSYQSQTPAPSTARKINPPRRNQSEDGEASLSQKSQTPAPSTTRKINPSRGNQSEDGETVLSYQSQTPAPSTARKIKPPKRNVEESVAGDDDRRSDYTYQTREEYTDYAENDRADQNKQKLGRLKTESVVEATPREEDDNASYVGGYSGDSHIQSQANSFSMKIESYGKKKIPLRRRPAN